jgi:hypothetical protein
MKKIISFCLYGDDPKYLNGMICNLELAKIIYPNWICRIYCSTLLSSNFISYYKNYENCELVFKEEIEDYPSMTWRFLAIDDPDVDVMLSRDSDSRLSYREKKCVDIFMESDYLFHDIRDNVNHSDVMGGLWGMKKNERLIMSDELQKWNHGNYYGSDQFFIRKISQDFFENSHLTHCSHFIKNFPLTDPSNYCVGEVFPGDNYNKPINHIWY